VCSKEQTPLKLAYVCIQSADVHAHPTPIPRVCCIAGSLLAASDVLAHSTAVMA
jgi:hypothetical protein